MWYANILAGAAFLLLGAATTILAWLDLPYTADFGPGPGFLPLWLGIGLMIFSIPVIVAEVINKAKSETLVRPETVKCVKVLILIVTVFLLLPVFGYAAGLALITAGGMRLMGRHSWGACAATVIVTAIVIHYLFGQWLGIPLPQGMIGW
ncbi:MAG: tripartite tricarboxylate transporter TctB family protein [Deltaproteobacteria bacterium]|nr:tripartite tricarboxylate transporter TctB family protein [Deltaproteobacteria bacterium]